MRPVRWHHRLTYAIAASGLWGLRRLPLSWAAWAGRRALALVRLALPGRRRIAEEQIRAALGTSAGEARLIARRMYDHLGTLIAEIAHIDRLRPETLPEILDAGDAITLCHALLAEGKGMLLVTGHLGNWEVAAAGASVLEREIFTVARPLDNPLLDRRVNGWRQRLGMRVLDKHTAMRPALRQLRAGGVFVMLTDQDAGREGRFVPFFGIRASTVAAAAELALRTGTPVLVMGMLRRGAAPLRFTIRHGEPIRADAGAGDRDAEVRRLLERINADLEAMIRAAPEQWLWLHRRWKTRPPDETTPPPMPVRRGHSV